MVNPNERIAMLLTIMRQLHEVMQAEHVLLREMRIDRLRELQLEKNDLAERYELELRILRSTPEMFAALSTEDRSALEEDMRVFRAALRRNSDRLTQARTIADGLIRTLTEASIGPAGPSVYGAASKPSNDASRIVAFAFDRSY